ncbi:MAG TPA: CinA family nicotinamide mononucleotide deamidase-related protein [Mycobacteriales bacterium]|jgi:nicotinamide-nucleotide amidase|nr:CinA family nicotinamide mononucleotide deamidase-related protein [Mycobacteriales bacterium]
MSAPRAALVAVGDELLNGDQVNGNAVVVGRALADFGVPVRAQFAVGDDTAQIAAAVLAAAADADVVVISGGLGPTQDDLTREGLARAAGVPLERDARLETELRARLSALGRRDIPEINMQQADLPRGARPLPNRVGTAPGIRLRLGERVIYALPGVPRELTGMLHDAVLPDLVGLFPHRLAVARATIRTVGLWESAVAEAMAPEVRRTGGTPIIGFLSSGGETRVEITASGVDLPTAQELLAPTVAFARRVLADAVYDAPSLPEEIVRLLTDTGATVACAESLTAGLLAARIADVPGASAVLRGGIVAYATALKADLLGVPRQQLAADGPVAASTAAAMAVGVAGRCAANYGIALTGVAGPAPQDGHPAGTVFVAVHGPAGTETARLQLPGDRPQIRSYAVTAALAMLRGAVRAASHRAAAGKA